MATEAARNLACGFCHLNKLAEQCPPSAPPANLNHASNLQAGRATRSSLREGRYAMKRILILVCVAGVALSAFGDASDKATLDQRVNDAKTVIQEVMQTPDKAIPDSVMENAKCVAVVPSVKKAAFIFGGEYGQGVVTCRTAHGWSGPVFIRVAGGSWGLQIGGQETDLVLIAVNDKGMQDLLKSKFKIGGDAAASAGPVGRNAAAATNWKLHSELLTYSRSQGLFAGIDLTGVSVTANTDDTNAFYGATHTFEQILRGRVPTPTAARSLVRTVAKYSRVSRAS